MLIIVVDCVKEQRVKTVEFTFFDWKLDAIKSSSY